MIQVAPYTYFNTPVTEITPTTSSRAPAALGKRNYGTGERRATMAATAADADASTRCQLADFGEGVTNAIIDKREESGRRRERESSERAAAATNGS